MATKPRRSAEPPAAPALGHRHRQFIGLSAALTGFNAVELHGTGMLEEYYDVIPSIVGDDFFGRLLTRWESIHARAGNDLDFQDDLMTSELFDDATLGPLAQNLGILWYLGMWYQLPQAWRQKHGAFALDSTKVVSSHAYQEALVWPAAHTHPPAAKQPGFGSWALKPEVAP